MVNSTFDTSLQSSHSIIVPDNIAESFLQKGYKRVIVQITFENKVVNFHAALQKFHGNYHITFNKENQKKLGVFDNDYFNVQLSEDTSKYGVEMPEEFEAVLLSDYEAFEIFEALTAGKKRSLIYYILKIKNSQTRIDKALIITENLKRGIRDNRQLIKKL
ncbi:YdeI/OmpD-associated family protein [Aquimarina sp. 2201CG5-10]|uniref:YdeI/OmpD-associated family protein n=1 Tax=Aquimarina callyspongiae TaxID=3098150 RepID=UPI002AB42ECA|nr:YdeI/OmpD-associated family protein [Aquimarina sp. 2201CG5-10]MDY8137365.1 YdeI/OmpD-associated family protein [Aquimarina sp. 2201CG5-10]